MIILLEGCNGVGKSTAAKLLSKRLGMPSYRVFRSVDAEHWGAGPMYHPPSGIQGWLKRVGVPTNSHVEELFLADFFAAFKPSAILDRSLPSAIAYGVTLGNADPTLLTDNNMEEIWNFWERKHAVAGTVLALLELPYDVARSRTDRPMPSAYDYGRLEAKFDQLYKLSSLPKFRFSTEGYTPDQTAEAIERFCQFMDGRR